MKLHATLIPFSKTDTYFLKGISILLIALHNFYRWVEPVTGENEFWFSPDYFRKAVTTLQMNPLEFVNVFFNFLGFYGVQGFILISAYGLTLSYRSKRPGYGPFIAGRFNKLYPAFFFAALLFIFLIIATTGRMIDPWTLKEIGIKLTLLGNFIPGKATTVCGPWWFYSFIVQFYLVFPLLIWLADKWGTRALIATAVAGYAFAILAFPIMEKHQLNPMFLVFGHLPEFCLGIWLASRKEVKISWGIVLLALAVFVSGNLVRFIWPFANLAAALLLWVAVSSMLKRLKPGNPAFRIIAFTGMVSMYIFAIQGFTRWNFVTLANTLSSPLTSLILGLLFLVFIAGTGYLMMVTEHGIRSWIASAATRSSRYLRFFLLPVLVLAAFAVLFTASTALAKREKSYSEKSVILASDSNTFEIHRKDLVNLYSNITPCRGAWCFRMPPPNSYSPCLELDFSQIDMRRLVEVDAGVMMFAADTLSVGQLVFEVLNRKTNERLVWKAASVDKAHFTLNKWIPCTFRYEVPREFLAPDYFVRVYVWNFSKGLFCIDDLTLQAKGIAE